MIQRARIGSQVVNVYGVAAKFFRDDWFNLLPPTPCQSTTYSRQMNARV